MESSGLKFKTFREFVSEQAYDEQDPAPKASYRAQDYQVKDDLASVAITIEEILRKIEDGEQLEEIQIKIVKEVLDNINRLKRQIQGKERIEDEKREKEEEERELNNDM